MAKNKKLRVILDTNLWISYLISKHLKRIDKLIAKDEIILIFSSECLEEFLEVAERPKFKEYFSTKDIQSLLNLFDVYGELVEVNSNVNVCRDSKDNFLLSLARDGKADYLITGDSDILELKNFEGTKIVTYSEFEKLESIN